MKYVVAIFALFLVIGGIGGAVLSPLLEMLNDNAEWIPALGYWESVMTLICVGFLLNLFRGIGVIADSNK